MSSWNEECGLAVLSYIIKVHDLEEKCLDCDHAVCWNLPQAQAVLKVNDELLVFDAMNSAEIQL